MHASATKTITIQYVAMFKDQADRSMEKIETEIKTCSELYEYLQEKYKFAIPLSQIRVAINHEFCPMTQLLKEQDLVIFIPPVCGG
ncbi:MoaD/ThiS family protein [Gloeomargaritales cyanobacterium VI4D9]|nr:MoaD/ThiS family protein [Gloeomargaritales cyanobacterium VI4D9]